MKYICLKNGKIFETRGKYMIIIIYNDEYIPFYELDEKEVLEIKNSEIKSSKFELENL